LIDREDPKIIWITCPDCGSRVGIVISVGKAVEAAPVTVKPTVDQWPPENVAEKLRAAGVDLNLINIEEGEELTIISPKKFLGDLWGPINDAIRSMGGIWMREGRDSRWEIKKETAGDQ
jgi:hypothetical protein